MQDPVMAPMVNEILNSATDYNFYLSSSVNLNSADKKLNSNSIRWNPEFSGKIKCFKGNTEGYMSPMIALGHEISHVAAPWYSFLQKAYYETAYHDVISSNYDNDAEEYRVVTGPEQSAQKTFGEPTRDNHKLFGYKLVEDPTKKLTGK